MYGKHHITYTLINLSIFAQLSQTILNLWTTIDVFIQLPLKENHLTAYITDSILSKAKSYQRSMLVNEFGRGDDRVEKLQIKK